MTAATFVILWGATSILQLFTSDCAWPAAASHFFGDDQLLSIILVEDLLWRQRAVAPLRRPLGSNRCPPSLHFRLCMTRSQTCQTRPEAASHGHGYFWVMAVIVSSLFYHCVTWLLLDNTRCFLRSKFFLYFFTPVIFYQGVSIETALSRYFAKFKLLGKDLI